jgi:hypothetical protein
MLRNWLMGISTKERNLIFVGAAALMWAIWYTRNDLSFEKRKFTSFMQDRGVYRLRFCPCCSVRIQGRLYVWRARYWRLSLWISSSRMNREAIIDFAFNSFKLFAYSFLYFSDCVVRIL